MTSIKKKYLSLAVFPLFLNGCATVLSGTTQQISLQAVDEKTNQILENVECTVTDGKGVTYRVHNNPGSFNVTKGNGALNPICKAAGYNQTSFGVGDSFNATTLVNVFFWPGFIVDAASGALKNYPSHIIVYLKKKNDPQK